MKFKIKRLVSAVIASLITCTACANNTNFKNNLLCGQNTVDVISCGNIDKLKNPDKGRSIAIKVLLGVLGTATTVAVASRVLSVDNRSGGDEFVDECMRIDSTTQSRFNDIGKQNNSFSDVLINNSSDYMYEDVVCFPSSYLISLAKQKFNECNPQASEKDEYDYIQKLERCYKAAVVLHSHYVTDGVESDCYTEALDLISIVDDMLKIPGIDRIIRPGHQIAFFILSQFVGNYEDTLAWVDRVGNYKSFTALKFKPGVGRERYLFDHTRRAELNLIKDMPLDVKRRSNGDIAIISKEDCDEYLEFIINSHNEKKIHYVFKSVEWLRSRDIWYKF